MCPVRSVRDFTFASHADTFAFAFTATAATAAAATLDGRGGRLSAESRGGRLGEKSRPNSH